MGVNSATSWPNYATALFQDEQVECVKEELTTAELQQKVKEYNAQVNSNLFMNSVSGLFVCLFCICSCCPVGDLSSV